MIFFIYTKINGFSGQNNISIELINILKEHNKGYKEIHLIPFRAKNYINKLKIILITFPILFLKSFRFFLLKDHKNLVISNFQQTLYSMFGFSIAMWPLKCILSKKISLILTLNGSIFYKWSDRSIKGRLFKFWLDRAQKVVVVGPLMSENLQRIFNLNINKIVQIDNFTTSRISDITEIHQKYQRTDTIDITYLSLFVEKKGYREFIEAIIQLSQKQFQSDIRINFCGKFVKTEECGVDHTPENLDRLIVQLEDAVNHNPRMSLRVYKNGIFGNEKEVVLTDTQIFVLPTYYANEAQPISLIEAGANGSAIISGKTGEIPFMFPTESIVYLDDVSGNIIAEKLELLISNKTHRLNMAIASFETVLDRYTEVKFRNRWIELIDKFHA